MKKISIIVLSFCALYSLWFGFESSRVLGYQQSSWTESQRADCAIVLTGSSGRVAEGFSLISQKRVRKLIISGVHPLAQLHEIFPHMAFYGDINPDDIILEKFSKTTFGNAQQSSAIISALRCSDSILITSDIHMYRSLKTFKASLPENYPIYARTIPSASRQDPLFSLILEVLKSQFYRIWAY